MTAEKPIPKLVSAHSILRDLVRAITDYRDCISDEGGKLEAECNKALVAAESFCKEMYE